MPAFRALAVALFLAPATCAGVTDPGAPAPVVSDERVVAVHCAPAAMTLEPGDKGLATCVPYNQHGAALAWAVNWSSKRTATATVLKGAGQTATVTGVAAGSTYIVGAYKGKRDSLPVTVRTGLPDTVVARVTVAPDTLRLVEFGAAGALTCAPATAAGTPLTAPCTWASRNTAVVTLTPGTGLATTATGLTRGRVWVEAAVQGKRDSALVEVACAAAGGWQIRPAALLARVLAALQGTGTTVLPHALSLDLDAGPTTGTLQGHVRDACGPITTSWAWTSRNTGIATVTSTTKSAVTATAVASGTTYLVGTANAASDSALVTVTGDPAGDVFFLADAEGGTMIPPWPASWAVIASSGNSAPTNSTTLAKTGSRSFRYEVVNPTEAAYAQTLTNNPQSPTGCQSGHYCNNTSYYSFWIYVDAGYTQSAWNMLLGWMTGVGGAPSPISHVELRMYNSVLQVHYVLKNCAVGLYTCPTFTGYDQPSTGYYFQTASSPNGITAVPTGQWVHFSIFYHMAAANGQVTIWQDGVIVMNLTAATMNTFGGHSIDPLGNAAGDMILQFGSYGGATSETRRIYVDDFTVSSTRVIP